MTEEEFKKRSEDLFNRMSDAIGDENILLVSQALVNILWNCLISMPKADQMLVRNGFMKMFEDVDKFADKENQSVN